MSTVSSEPPVTAIAGWLTIEQLAEQLQVTKQTIRNMIARGQLEAVRVGDRMVRINPASLTVRKIGGGAA